MIALLEYIVTIAVLSKNCSNMSDLIHRLGLAHLSD